MIEEHVIKLAELQAERTYAEAEAESASMDVDEMIRSVEVDLMDLKSKREELRRPHIEVAEELSTTIGDLYATIIDEWTGENKTMVFDAGTLKFRQTGSLKIHDEVWLMNDILDRMSVEDLIKKKYLKGFSLTAVKKYMGVHELPIDVAEIKYKTTVKLEQKE